MNGPTVVFISLFVVIFGICYLYFWTRNKERMALIEKGADASIFVGGKKEKRAPAPVWKIVISNLALLLMGIGAGIIIGGVLWHHGVNNEIAMPGSIFLMAGTGLLIGFFITKRLYREEKE
ncbi:DUF6249 domain-containing protein [Flagellimonas onchidii]|uniref:DUF6249 domain-containing protein n=1 Tax=Flagellimonas onchidii TaxID=2562684 RepID=UPI0010A6306D|nr:DUF6249 domain-containing protein [Allomuricauda onchidii]